MSALSRALWCGALCGLMLVGGVAIAADRDVDKKAAAIANVDAGVTYLQRGQFQDAKDKLERAEQQDPKNYKVHWALASLWEHLDRTADADRAYRKAMKLSPDNPDITNTYAVFLCKSGKVDEALAQFDGVLKNKLYRTPWVVATNAAVCLRSEKRNADALAYLERALFLRSDFLDAVIQKADLQLLVGRAAQARQTIDAYLAAPGRKSADLLLIGVRAARADADQVATDNYARLLRRDFPNSPQTQVLPQVLQAGK